MKSQSLVIIVISLVIEFGGTTDLAVHINPGQGERFFENLFNPALNVDDAAIGSSQGEHDINFQSFNRAMVNNILDVTVIPHTFDGLTSIRNRIRKKLASYAEQVKLVHGLGLPDTDDFTDDKKVRHKRDTIFADKLTSAIARKRRNYAAQSFDLSILDAGVTHVVKRAYQLQHPSFDGLNVTDLNVITYGDIPYLIAVQRNYSETSTVFYKFLQNWELEEIGRLYTPEALIVEVVEIEAFYYVLPASYSQVNEYSLEGGSPLYRVDFRDNGKFNAVKIQAINTELARSIIFWRSSAIDANDVILCVAPEKTLTSQGYRYKVNISCYRWQGGYFDLTYSLPAYNPQAVSHMSISSHNYICVANYQDDSGSTSIFSTVFRYSHKKGNFLPFQKIQTYGAKDCKHFRFDSQEQVKEHYLAIANFGQVDEHGKVDYNVKSYIFKFGVGRFILFQSLVTIGAFQILPVQDGSKFLMIIGELYRLSIYQHNGWNFVKTREINFPQEDLVNQFRMRPLLFNNQTYFTVASPKLPTQSGIYGLEYEGKNDFVTMTKDLEEWCTKAVQTVESTDLVQLADAAGRVPNSTQPEIIIKSPLTFTSNLHASSIFTQSLQYNDVHFDAERSKSLARKEQRLEALETRINVMYAKLHNAISLNGDQIVKTRVEFSQWSVSNQSDVTATSVKTNRLNNTNLVDLIKNLVFLDQNYKLKTVMINVLQASQEIQAQQLNGNSINDLVLKSTPNVQTFLEDNVFLKNITALSGFNVSDSINGVRTNEILTVRSDQYFSEINIASSVVSNLVAKYINGVTLQSFIDKSVSTSSGDHEILGDKYFQNLTSHELWAQNYLSGYQILSFYTDAVYLSNITKDTFTGLPIFESVIVTSLETANELINNLYNLEKDFMSAKDGVIVSEDVTIYNHASIENLDVTRSLNGISVDEHKELDVVLKHSATTQKLTGQNIHALRLERPSTLEGKLNGIDLKTWNQTKIIQLENPNITGKVFAWNVSFTLGLTAQEFVQGPPNSSLSILSILQNSIPLNTAEFQCSRSSTLIFDSLEVLNNSKIETVNNISPTRDWIQSDGKDEINIESTKHFFGNVILLNNSITTYGLEVPVGDRTYTNFMEIFSQLHNTLLNGTNQVIRGNFVFNGLRVGQLVSEERITLNGIDFNDILLTEPGQTIQVENNFFKSGLTVKNNLDITGHLQTSLINGMNLEASFADTLKTHSPSVQIIRGNPTFLDGLYLHKVDSFGQLGDYNIEDLFRHIVLNSGMKDDREVTINGSLVFHRLANFSSLDYLGAMNGILPDQWGQEWMTRLGNQEITTPLHLLNSLAVNKVFVVDNQVNNIDVTRLDQDILKRSQNGFIEQATFHGPVITQGDICSRSMNGFDVTRDLFRKNSPQPQTITSQKVFKGPWTILENLNAPNLANVDFVNIARFAYPVQDLTLNENLTVFGNCHSDLEPGIFYGGNVNGHSWTDVLRSGWFANENSVIATPIQFSPQSVLHLNNGGEVHGLIDGVDVNSLDQQYLSLSKDQDWTGNFEFHSKVCMNELQVEATEIQNGSLNGLDILTFSSSTLLDGVEQNVTSKLVSKTLTAPQIMLLNGTIGGMDFCKNVATVSGDNTVPIMGLKHAQDLLVETLQLQPGAIVNGVLLDWWEKLALRTNGNFVLNGDRKFENAVFNDATVEGLADGKSINSETVMTLTGSQTGTGVIIIDQNNDTPTTTGFGRIYSRGTVSGENLDEYFGKLVLVNGTEPLYIYGKKDIQGKVYTNWMKTEGPYEQHGINLMEFLSNYSADSYIGQKYNVALQEKYNKISNLTTDLIQVATERAVMTKCFESISRINIPGIVDLRAFNVLDKPMVGIVYNKGHGIEIGVWLTYNMTANEYQLNDIAQYAGVGQSVDFSEHKHNGHYFVFVALSSVNNTEVNSTIPAVPSDNDFLLNNETGKLSKGVVLRLVEEEEVNGKTRFGFVVQQILFGDDFGNVLSFYLVTASGSRRNCVMYSVLDQNNFHSLIFCFHPLDFQEIDDNAVHFFQNIPLTIAPKLTSMVVGNKTLILLSGSGNSTSTMESDNNGHGGVVTVWTHEQGDGPLVQEDCFPVLNILNIDSILAPNDNPFLAVVSGRLPRTNHLGLVFVYKYSVSRKKFIKYQTIQENNPIDARFQRLLPSDETFLYILTGTNFHNVNVYSFKGVSGWNKEYSFTSEGGTFIETAAFYYQADYRAHALIVNSTNVNVINVNFNGVPAHTPPGLTRSAKLY